MSGWSEAIDCPECGAEESLETWGDRNEVGGECLECGYCYKTVDDQMTLEEVNEERARCGMEPLTQLRLKLKKGG